MMRKDLLPYQHKKVKIFLTNGYAYTGHILEYGENCLIFFDKLGLTSSFSYENITSISQVRA